MRVAGAADAIEIVVVLGDVRIAGAVIAAVGIAVAVAVEADLAGCPAYERVGDRDVDRGWGVGGNANRVEAEYAVTTRENEQGCGHEAHFRHRRFEGVRLTRMETDKTQPGAGGPHP